MDLSLLHLHWTARKKQNKEYRTYSLARSVRVNAKIYKQIIFKLGRLTDEEVAQWRKNLQILKQFRAFNINLSSEMSKNFSKDDLQQLINEASKKKFDYAEDDRKVDLELCQKVFEQAFEEVSDPREHDNLRYPFYGLLLIILSATLASAKSIRGIYEYAREKAFIFCPLLGMDRMPEYMVFWWILTRIDSNMLNQVFIRWISTIADALLVKGTRRIAIDGKALRGAKKNSVHYVSAYESNRGLLLGQVKTKLKSNEITAIPELLKVIDIKGAIVTIDAAGCQKSIVRDIRDRQGHYLIALKGNQENLHAEAKNFFKQARAIGFKGTGCSHAKTVNEGHGRIEKREIAVIEDLDWLDCKEEWKDLAAMIEIKSIRTVKEITTTECRYYITSKGMKANIAGSVIRSHWGIENNLHWMLDVFFNDDNSKANRGHAAENLGLFRRMAYCLLKQDTIKGRGLATRQRKAMWNDSYTLELLGNFIYQASQQTL
jgi:predicted transposase YbfD/YdcC